MNLQHRLAGSLTAEQAARYDAEGYLVRSRQHPERIATLEDWLAKRPEHAAANSVAAIV
jgi:hypothetical protein